MESKFPSRAVLLVGLIVLLAPACAPSKPPNMTDVCQMRDCVCAQDEAFWRLSDRQPVQWDDQGRPFCPPGAVLQVKEEKRN